MTLKTFDVIVVGGGPGGYVAAIKAAQLGLSVALVEKRKTLGGTCLNVGCIPSKALLHATEKLLEWSHLQEFGITAKGIHCDLPTLMRKKESIVASLTQGIDFLFKKNKVTRIEGSATLVASDEVVVSGYGHMSAKKGIILATGSINVDLPNVAIDEEIIVSSTGALAWKKVPARLAVIGGGYIGLEMASIWSRLGSTVTVIEFQNRLIPFMDEDLTRALKEILEKQGITIALETKVLKVEKKEEKTAVYLEKGEKKEVIEADAVLVAVGRRPYTEGLGLEAIGVAKNEKGFIEVNDRLETSIKGIYAIGDVTSGAMLAHRAEEDGVAVAEIIAGQHPILDHHLMPCVVYTCPEVASVGQNERELKDAGRSYKVGKFPFAANSRAKANGLHEGFVKILSDATSDEILGVHIIGDGAGTLIGECVVAMSYKAASEDLARIVHAHPTTNEALKEAALASYFKALHT